MGFFNKLFSGKSEAEQREVTFRVDEDLVGKEGMSDPTTLQAMFLKFFNEKSDQIDSEIIDLITNKSLSIKTVSMAKTADDKGTDVTYLIEFT